MTFEQFESFQASILREVEEMGSTKGREYAYSEKDRFQNFNEIAQDMEIDRLKVAMIYTEKHIRSLKSFINKKKIYSNETIRSRIIDIIVYMTLIAGMIEEEDCMKEEIEPIQFIDPEFIRRME